MKCAICNEDLILVGGGWVCINPYCSSAGRVIKGNNRGNDNE